MTAVATAVSTAVSAAVATVLRSQIDENGTLLIQGKIAFLSI